MKIVALIAAFFLTVTCSAQIFAPTEAVWYYTYDPDITLEDGYQKIEIVGDSLINNKICKVLQKTNIGYNYWDKEYEIKVPIVIKPYNEMAYVMRLKCYI